jgi:hypothetical protein
VVCRTVSTVVVSCVWRVLVSNRYVRHLHGLGPGSNCDGNLRKGAACRLSIDVLPLNVIVVKNGGDTSHCHHWAIRKNRYSISVIHFQVSYLTLWRRNFLLNFSTPCI